MIPSASAKFNISPVSLHVPDNEQYHMQREGSSNLCWISVPLRGVQKSVVSMSRPVLLTPEK